MKKGYVDTPMGQIHYREVGEGEPVVVLHQTPSSSVLMEPLMHGLAKEMRAIGMDTPGYGFSDRPNKDGKVMPYTSMEQFAQSVAWFIQGLGLEKVHIFGDHTGSQIALQTAADFPELVKSVAVFEPFNWGTPSRRAVHERLHRYHTRTEDGSYLMELWDRVKNSPDIRTREQNFRDFLASNDESDVYGSMGWEGAGPYAMTRQDMWSVAPRITARTYVMYPSDSELLRAYDRFMSTLPNAVGTLEAPPLRRDGEAGAEDLLKFYRTVK